MSIEYKSGGEASKGHLGRGVPLKPSNLTLFKTKIAHLGTLLKNLFYDVDSFCFYTCRIRPGNFQTYIMVINVLEKLLVPQMLK